VPDVRQLDRNGDPTASIGVAYFATFMCLLWLIAGSYFMVACLEKLAELMNIPDAVIGVTVSAAGASNVPRKPFDWYPFSHARCFLSFQNPGTSLPNYVASKVAAENGFGNQAVSNAFGSNTFNIMVGLGLPWLLYTSFGTGFEPYHGLEAEGILESIIILACVLLVFVVLMLQTGFVIYKWHGNLFIALYFAYIALAIGQVYL
jgi:Ca2+/Na+ antiporter